MNRAERRRHAKRMRAQYPKDLTRVPESDWPDMPDPKRRAVWVSRYYLVQLFEESCGYRISVNRTTLTTGGRWADDIPWDALQHIKRAIGLGKRQAVEIYPPDGQLVNVANMRHLWILANPVEAGW